MDELFGFLVDAIVFALWPRGKRGFRLATFILGWLLAILAFSAAYQSYYWPALGLAVLAGVSIYWSAKNSSHTETPN